LWPFSVACTPKPLSNLLALEPFALLGHQAGSRAAPFSYLFCYPGKRFTPKQKQGCPFRLAQRTVLHQELKRLAMMLIRKRWKEAQKTHRPKPVRISLLGYLWLEQQLHRELQLPR
jgi:hypothetical protein